MLKILIYINAVADLITGFENINLLSDVQNINTNEFPDYGKVYYYLKTVPRKMHNNIKLGNRHIISKPIMDFAPDLSLTNTTSDSSGFTSTTQQNGMQSSSESAFKEVFTEQTSSSQCITDSKLPSLSTTACTESTTASSAATTVYSESTTACLENQTISTTIQSTISTTECNNNTLTTATESTITNTGSTLTNTGSPVTNTDSPITNTGSTITNTGSTITNTGSTITNTGSTITTSISEVGGESVTPKKEESVDNIQAVKIGKVICPICHTHLLITLEIF